jgi:hypothetical protein
MDGGYPALYVQPTDSTTVRTEFRQITVFAFRFDACCHLEFAVCRWAGIRVFAGGLDLIGFPRAGAICRMLITMRLRSLGWPQCALVKADTGAGKRLTRGRRQGNVHILKTITLGYLLGGEVLLPRP